MRGSCAGKRTSARRAKGGDQGLPPDARRRGRAPDALERSTRLSIAVDKNGEAADYLRRLAVSLAGEARGCAGRRAGGRVGRYDDAVDLAHQSRLGDGSIHQAARRPLGVALYHQGKFADAIEQLEKADANADGLAALMKALAALGRLTDAEAQLTRLETVEPSAESRQAVAWVRSLVTRRTALTPSVRCLGDDTSRLDFDRENRVARKDSTNSDSGRNKSMPCLTMRSPSVSRAAQLSACEQRSVLVVANSRLPCAMPNRRSI